MIVLAALDMAGTTIDENGAVYVALNDAVVEDPINAGTQISPEDLQTWMGTEKRAAIRALTEIVSGASPDDAAVDRMFQRFRDQLTEAYRARPPTPIDGVLAAFDDLRERGVRIALTTGFSQDIAHSLLDSLGWTVGNQTGTVDAMVCGDEVAAGRPAPYLIFQAMERTGVDSVDQVVVAGDTVADLRAGINAGVRGVVGVASGALTLAQLAPHRHTHLLSGVRELPGLLDSL